MTAVEYISMYEQRVRLVQNAMTKHSELDDKTSYELAVHILDALDHIPERRRGSSAPRPRRGGPR